MWEPPDFAKIPETLRYCGPKIILSDNRGYIVCCSIVCAVHVFYYRMEILPFLIEMSATVVSVREPLQLGNPYFEFIRLQASLSQPLIKTQHYLITPPRHIPPQSCQIVVSPPPSVSLD